MRSRYLPRSRFGSGGCPVLPSGEDNYAAVARDMDIDPASKQTVPWVSSDKKFITSMFRNILSPMEKDGVDFWWLDWQQSLYDAKHTGDEFLVGRNPRYGLLRSRIDIHIPCYGGIVVFTALHAIGRMEVERRTNPFFIEPCEELLRIGEKIAVPRPARPTTTLSEEYCCTLCMEARNETDREPQGYLPHAGRLRRRHLYLR